MKKYLVNTILVLVAAFSAKAQSNSFIITGITIHTATDRILEDAAIGVRDGKITYVGSEANAPKAEYAEVLGRKGMIAYPGLIAPNTTLGLTELFAVRATRDFNETGAMNPNVRSIIAYNAESDIAATVLANGVLFAQTCPRGGIISGTSSVVALHGWNWEDAAYRIDDGVHMGWPSMFKRKGEEADDPKGYEFDIKYTEKLGEIKRFFSEAKAYSKRPTPLERDLRLEAMKGLFDGSKTLFVRSDFIKEIREAISFSREMGIEKLVIVGGYDSWMATDLLKENKIAVLINRVNSLPRFAEDAVDAAYSLAAKLSNAGVLFAFQMDGDMETMQNRNLAFNAGTAIGYGLPANEALKACTIYPARILGIDKRTGSIEVGKEANFILTTGDLFEMKTSVVREIFLFGKLTVPDNRQDALYEKYKAKYSARP